MVNREQRTLMGAYIRQQRKLADLSMRQVSAMVGISNPYLSQIERGLRSPSEAVAAGIATALGISVEEFHARYDADEERTDLLEAIENAAELTLAQKASLAEIYRSFVRANDRDRPPADAAAQDGDQSQDGTPPDRQTGDNEQDTGHA
jgi:transcriptional regulator with XRE-family HTH domain